MVVGLSKKQKEDMNKASNLLNATERFPNTRLAHGVTNRSEQIMTWRLPNGTTIQMYINPENFVIAKTKQINFTRTKGGFVVQYWGDNLDRLTLSGTTGSSGIRGINVLNDIYKAENRAFEVVAGGQTNELFNALQTGSFTDSSIGDSLIPNLAKELRDRNFILRPSLASLALGIVLYYQGVQYKGFFTEFSVTESVSKLGLFDYSLTFMVTETRGIRENFMAWHREPLANDQAGQLANAALNAAGNALRNFAGLGSQSQTPMEFHPENAPLTFGGNSISSMFGFEATGVGRFDTSEPDRLEILPGSVTVNDGDTHVFNGKGGTPHGGARPYRYSFVTNNSLGSIDKFTGKYKAGRGRVDLQTLASVTDKIKITDSEGNSAEATITVNLTYNAEWRT